jgi:hypothetical protein
MVALLPPAELQFCDANGVPLAGGQLFTYVPGTTTPKATWSEATGTALNTNPIVLDAGGRCIMYGDGVYRTILMDAAGNLIFDQLTSSLVSSAMAPVISAPDLATARSLLGVIDPTASLAALSAALATETAARVSGDSTESAARIAADNTESAARIAADNAINALIATLPTATGFPAGIRLQYGNGITDSSGNLTVTFPIAFSAAPTVFVTEQSGPSFSGLASYAITSTSFQVFSTKSFTTGAGLGPAGFAWLALGAQ